MKTTLIILLVLAGTHYSCNQKNSVGSLSFSQYVKPLIGTSGHGHTFPGASTPFGMVQLSPDTYNEGWDWCSGYHYSDSSIMGFSHTHLSGTGRGELMDILFMPTTGKMQFDPGTRENPDLGYRSRFSHEKEVARAGYYSVFLEDYEILAELTATTRAGFHSYTFENNENRNLIIDLAHSFKTDSILECGLRIINDSLITGFHRSKGWGEGNEKYFVEHSVYFAARFNQTFDSVITWIDGEINPASVLSSGKHVKAGLKFKNSGNKRLLVKVGISGVDEAGALKNLDSEIVGWDFNKTVFAADSSWNKLLGIISVSGDDHFLKETFYTSLYHACLAPFTASDHEGEYTGFDGIVRKTKGYTMLTGLSLWDTFRAANPLYTLISPEIVTDIVLSMLTQFDEYGLLPVWPLCNSETNCMIGYHSVPVIADAYLKGITGFDPLKAFEAMKISSLQDDFDIKWLKEFNYIPRDMAKEISVARTLEYSFDDWCIAQMAKKLGKEEDYDYFSHRARAYANVFDSVTGFMRGKDSKGNFRNDFDPYNAVNATSDFIEGNSWQYSWFVPHDINFLVNGMGGKKSFTSRLDTLFTTFKELDENTPVDVSGLIGQYAHGNEPSHHVAYLYSFGDAPWKTQEKVDEILRTMYSNQPDGLCGNEDMGQMSAWYIFSALGFYPVNPAGGNYVFGKPVFEEASLNLPSGNQFTIKAHNLSEENIYISRIFLNGSEYSKGFISHDQIMAGGLLEFEMSKVPGKVLEME